MNEVFKELLILCSLMCSLFLSKKYKRNKLHFWEVYKICFLSNNLIEG